MYPVNVIDKGSKKKSHFRTEMNVVALKYEGFNDILEVSLHCEDLTLILEDGKYSCNSFLCASIFPIFVNILESSLEEQFVISLPDFKCQEFSNFFTSIYNRKSELEVSENIQYLLEPAATNYQEVDYEIRNVDGDGPFSYREEDEVGDDPDLDIDMKEIITCSDIGSDRDEATLNQIQENFTAKPKNLPYRISVMANENDKNCLCGVKFSTQKKKAEHYRIVHLGHQKCGRCNKITVTLDQSRHKCRPNPKKVSKKIEVSCNKCDRLFNSHSALFYHNHAEHGQAAGCHVCGKVFQSKVHLKEHLNRTHQEKTTCNICGLVVKHMKQHLDNVHKSDCDKRYRCEYCSKSFDQSDKMKRHQMSVHLKLQPFKCRYGCGLAYNDRSNRNQHERKKHGRMAETSFVKHNRPVNI